jgi:hypothetical protein
VEWLIKRRGTFGLDSGFDTRCLKFFITIYSGTLANSQLQSTALLLLHTHTHTHTQTHPHPHTNTNPHNTLTHSVLSVCWPIPVPSFRLLTADVSLPVCPNCPRPTATTTATQSVLSITNCLLLAPTVLSAILSNNWLAWALSNNKLTGSLSNSWLLTVRQLRRRYWEVQILREKCLIF